MANFTMIRLTWLVNRSDVRIIIVNTMSQISGEIELLIALKNLHANRGGSFFLGLHFCNLVQIDLL
ncbi:hypothetical protein BST85_04190 [Aureitalea marina]|uniref:Uncharacterized protein n=1 Tax=Aureitalea marina TaxID=930804 RepID=A0A2S7KNK2_9FLAO|nr:hypothetical protein BST85_04190 [Aureitalea marina]